jgi:hypothetical protein
LRNDNSGDGWICSTRGSDEAKERGVIMRKLALAWPIFQMLVIAHHPKAYEDPAITAAIRKRQSRITRTTRGYYWPQ